MRNNNSLRWHFAIKQKSYIKLANGKKNKIMHRKMYF